MHYNGSKGGSGVYQRIISLMPVHEVYIETHLGGGNILQRKRRAPEGSIAIEIDRDVLCRFRVHNERLNHPLRIQYVHGDCLDFLRSYDFTGKELVYSDPPYLMEVRRSSKPLYRYEYSRENHVELLQVLACLPCYVMLSGYDNDLYNHMLAGWTTFSFGAQSRHGRRLETVWMNFDADLHLKHEYRYIGRDFRERERIRKKAARWVSNLAAMPADERHFILARIAGRFPEAVHHHTPPMAVEAYTDVYSSAHEVEEGFGRKHRE